MPPDETTVNETTRMPVFPLTTETANYATPDEVTVPILIYHQFSDTPYNTWMVTPQTFETHRKQRLYLNNVR